MRKFSLPNGFYLGQPLNQFQDLFDGVEFDSSNTYNIDQTLNLFPAIEFDNINTFLVTPFNNLDASITLNVNNSYITDIGNNLNANLNLNGINNYITNVINNLTTNLNLLESNICDFVVGIDIDVNQSNNGICGFSISLHVDFDTSSISDPINNIIFDPQVNFECSLNFNSSNGFNLLVGNVIDTSITYSGNNNYNNQNAVNFQLIIGLNVNNTFNILSGLNFETLINFSGNNNYLLIPNDVINASITLGSKMQSEPEVISAHAISEESISGSINRFGKSSINFRIVFDEFVDFSSNNTVSFEGSRSVEGSVSFIQQVKIFAETDFPFDFKLNKAMMDFIFASCDYLEPCD